MMNLRELKVRGAMPTCAGVTSSPMPLPTFVLTHNVTNGYGPNPYTQTMVYVP